MTSRKRFKVELPPDSHCARCGNILKENQEIVYWPDGFCHLSCATQFRLVDLDPRQIKIPEVRLRSEFDPSEEEIFQQSVDARGVIYPPIVFRDDSGSYWLADGEHRLRAEMSKMLTFGSPDFKIKAYVRYGSEEDAILWSGINLERGKVTTIQKIEVATKLKRKGWTQTKIAEMLRCDESTVSKFIAIGECETAFQKLKSGEITSYERAYTLAQELSKPESAAPKSPAPVEDSGQPMLEGFETSGKSFESKPEAGEGGIQRVIQPKPTMSKLEESTKPGEGAKHPRIYERPKSRYSQYCAYCGRAIIAEDPGLITVHQRCLDAAISYLDSRLDAHDTQE